MSESRLFVAHDPIAELLDDMALIGAHWTRNRDKGRSPSAIRAAMILVARDLVALCDQANQLQSPGQSQENQK